MGSVLRKAVAPIRGEAYTTMIGRFCSILLGFERRMRSSWTWRAYVLVNNRAEGNAPLTLQGRVGMLRS